MFITERVLFSAQQHATFSLQQHSTLVKFVYRILHWDDTVVYNGKKIDPVNVKREKGQGGSDDEVT